MAALVVSPVAVAVVGLLAPLGDRIVPGNEAAELTLTSVLEDLILFRERRERFWRFFDWT